MNSLAISCEVFMQTNITNTLHSDGNSHKVVAHLVSKDERRFE